MIESFELFWVLIYHLFCLRIAVTPGMSTPEEAQAAFLALVEGYHATKYVLYLAVAGAAALVADFLYTFPDEVRLIWPTPLSIPKVLFLAVRYYAFINCIFALQSCNVRIRTPTLVTTELGLNALNRVDVQFPVKNIVCIPAAAETKLFAVVFALFLAGVSVVMFTMLIILFLKYKSVNSSLVGVFFRDGAFYFVCLGAIATANLIVNVASAPAYKFLLSQPEANLHAILSTRMLLHLRSSLEREQNGGRSTFTRDAWTSVYDVSGSGIYPIKRKRARRSSPMRFNEWETRDTERTMGTERTESTL
ncbi:hypothetical protein MD484_g7530, partial [Candolleomyces efflorescens]